MQLTEDQRAIRELAAQFAKTDMLPFAATWDREHTFPVETLKKAASLGFAGINAREQWGGSGLSRQEGVFIYEQLASACPSTTAYLSVHNMVVWLIDTFANSALAEKWLPQLTRMDCFGSYCLTEPNAGSDAASLTTSATLEGDAYIVSGQKVFISGAGASDVYVTMVRTGEAGPKGISCLLIEKNSEGLHFGELEKKLGWHSQPTRMVFFDKVRVPKQHLIGELGQGFKIALSALNGGRVNIAACSLGGAQACLDLAMNHIQERKQFGKSLAEFQNTQFKIADMATELAAARLLVYQAAERLDAQDPEAPMMSAMAKRFATDTGFAICNQALQLFGGYGYLQDYPIERYLRDLRVHQILEGTNEIMRLIIARQLLSVR